MNATTVPMSWFRDAATRRFVMLGYLPWLAGLSILWEAAHLPLYTIWHDASASYMAFAAAHCTGGDVLIGAASLALALVVGREQSLTDWRWRRIAFVTAHVGPSYTAFSEWLNVAILQNWAYSYLMPVIEMGSVRIGMSPLLQWVVIPPLSLYLGHRKFIAWSNSNSTD